MSEASAIRVGDAPFEPNLGPSPLGSGGVGERGRPPSVRAIGDYRAFAVGVSEGSAKGWSMATAGGVNHCAPSAVT